MESILSIVGMLAALLPSSASLRSTYRKRKTGIDRAAAGVMNPLGLQLIFSSTDAPR